MVTSPKALLSCSKTRKRNRKVREKFGGSKVHPLRRRFGSQVGPIDRVKASLEREGISYTELGGVQPNPRAGLVYEVSTFAGRKM